ncbi:MAG TPA: hypothetical protein VMU32_02690 [Solirubrobacteraceae bacterium]|nr:hypothetical protein [Solirubrobacteraceae bacterium]
MSGSTAEVGAIVAPAPIRVGPMLSSRSWKTWVIRQAPRLTAQPSPSSTTSYSVTAVVSHHTPRPTPAPIARRYRDIRGVPIANRSSHSPASCSWAELTSSSRHTKNDHSGCRPGR